MTCVEFEAQIGECHGTPDRAAHPALAQHLAGCEGCRRIAADFRAIRAAAGSLESRVPPPQVWSRIAETIDADRRRPGWRVDVRWRQVAAAAAIVLMVAGVGWLAWRDLAPGVAGQASVAGVDQADLNTDAVPSIETVRVAEKSFVDAITGLEAITTADAASLDVDTAGAVKASLTALDQAIGESRAALETEPENEVAQQSLFEALRSKVTLLQDVLALINEVRQGDQEGAARIMSDMNNP